MHELTVHGESLTTINMVMRFYHKPKEDIHRSIFSILFLNLKINIVMK